MPPVRRRLLNLLAGLSLLLCVAVEGMWVQSEFRPALWAWPLNPRWQFYSAAGELEVTHAVPPRAGLVPVVAHFETWPIPYWFLSVVAAAIASPLLIVWTVRRRRKVRAERGLCPSCGYDLRATLGWCPECGATPH
jgi:hypothetical protein